jgi:hypothetical protein
MKTYSQFLADAWISPSQKKLRGGTKSPLQVAREKGTDITKVSSSVRRFAEPINDPRHPDIEYSRSDDTHTFKHRKQPIQVSYSPSEKTPNAFVQNTVTTGTPKNRIGAARAMQDMKTAVSFAAKPGTVLQSQPVGTRRASLNSRTQGMSKPDDSGTQSGIVRHRSPKQKQKNTKPLDPINT